MVQLQNLGKYRQQHGSGNCDEYEGDKKADHHAVEMLHVVRTAFPNAY